MPVDILCNKIAELSDELTEQQKWREKYECILANLWHTINDCSRIRRFLMWLLIPKSTRIFRSIDRYNYEP